MALHDTSMDSSFLSADPPPGDDYQPKTDLATEYFNTFNQICENYREEPLRSTSDSLRLTTEILDSVREYDKIPEYVTTDFSERFLREEQVFQFGQPDASALLRHRARRRFNEEHGLPAVTSQESGVSCYIRIVTPGFQNDGQMLSISHQLCYRIDQNSAIHVWKYVLGFTEQAFEI